MRYIEIEGKTLKEVQDSANQALEQIWKYVQNFDYIVSGGVVRLRIPIWKVIDLNDKEIPMVQQPAISFTSGGTDADRDAAIVSILAVLKNFGATE